MSPLFLFAALVLGAEPPLDFDTDVLPVLTKSGCNAAACHGAAAGRGGFKLSLFAGDPAADYDAIVRELEGRRVDLARPQQSLLLAKPTEELDHGGGRKLEPAGQDAKLIAAWIGSGAPRPLLRKLARLEFEPRETIVPTVPAEIQLKVSAIFDDGLRRDVTADAIYLPADPAAIESLGKGRVAAQRPGRHTVVIRYLHFVGTVEITVPLGPEPIDFSKTPRANWIDEEVLTTLAALRLAPAPRADDATLLRRLTLDLTGRLPEPEQVRQYLADADPAKYGKLVERLLASPEYVDYWTYRFGKVLRIGAAGQDRAGATAFRAWLRRQIEQGTPLDRVATELITAEGDSHTVGPANFHRVAGDARTQAEYVTESLLGVRLRCANCHNHPLDRWTQDDYHGLAAVFARIDRGRNVRLLPRGEVTHPRTGEPAVPRLPGERFLSADDNGRAALAQWVTSPDNPYFAKAAVNRIWKALFGRGLVEPADDLRATNPATHPALLDRLAADFREHGHDLRHTLRLLATSEAYARTSHGTKQSIADDRFYSRALSRPLEAEVLADALADATGVVESYVQAESAGEPPPAEFTRAILLVGPQVESAALDILGRCGRDDTCATADSSQRGLATRLHLINGALINRKLGAAEGRLARALSGGRTNAQIVEDFYLVALGRFPRDDEQAFWNKELAAGDNADLRRRGLEDFLWGLVTCREFASNH